MFFFVNNLSTKEARNTPRIQPAAVAADIIFGMGGRTKGGSRKVLIRQLTYPIPISKNTPVLGKYISKGP